MSESEAVANEKKWHAMFKDMRKRCEWFNCIANDIDFQLMFHWFPYENDIEAFIANDELVRRLLAGEKPPYTWRKCLYLEWFSNANGRVVIQSTRLEVERLGERAFELTEEKWKEQAKSNAEELNHFMAQLGDVLRSDDPDEES